MVNKSTDERGTVKLSEAVVRDFVLPAGVTRVRLWDATLPGFGVIIGRRFKSYVVQRRVKGERNATLTTIGHHGSPGAGDDHGERWTEKRARAEAMRLLGSMSAGIAPRADKRAEAGGPTLATALEFHLDKMRRGENRRGKVCSPRSIRSIESEVAKHLAEHLDRPLVELTADALDAARKRIESGTKPIADSVNPPGRALANRLLAHVRAIWRSYHRRHGLPLANPADRLIQGALAPRDARIPDDGFAAWHTTVMAMENPVRRDFQRVALFTGVRTEGLRSLRWDDIDADDELILIRKAKGDRPYTIPMVNTVRAILDARRDGNAKQFASMGGDHGWCFPAHSRDGKNVIAIVESKERRNAVDDRGRVVRDDDGTPVRVKSLPGIHVSRRTFNSVAIEIGIPREAREALMNHEGRGVNVKHYGRPQNWDHLRECATRIEAALLERIKGKRARPLRRA